MTDSPQIVWSTESCFATTSTAYREFVEAARLRPLVARQLRRLRSGADVVAVGASIRTAFFDAELPAGLAESISAAYRQLGGTGTAVAVRSDAPDENLLDASLAGRQETFLNVRETLPLLAACKRCWASLFTDRAIIYREVRDIDHLSVTLSVDIQRMVPSEIGSARELSEDGLVLAGAAAASR
jgi:phosphoenolpyruvate synthase/pyruvate phosphate dikinase